VALNKIEKYWPNATTFNPDRWFTNEELVPSFVFGGGQRFCIGRQLARNMQIPLLTILMVRKFKFTLSTECDPTEIQLITLKPKRIVINLEKI